MAGRVRKRIVGGLLGVAVAAGIVYSAAAALVSLFLSLFGPFDDMGLGATVFLCCAWLLVLGLGLPSAIIAGAVIGARLGVRQRPDRTAT
jgi:hypothetical protein